MLPFLIFKVVLVAGVLAFAFIELYRTRKDLARMRAERLAREAADAMPLPVAELDPREDQRRVAHG